MFDLEITFTTGGVRTFVATVSMIPKTHMAQVPLQTRRAPRGASGACGKKGIMNSAVTAPKATPPRTHVRRLFWLCFIAPLVAIVIVAGGFVLGQSVLPEHWVMHVDGLGNITSGPWWAFFAGTVGSAGLAFLLGQYLARDFTKLRHWYAQQKGIVIGCFAFGYAVLGLFLGNILAALSPGEAATVEASMGYGLLSFVLFAIGAAALYTWLLPKAQPVR